MKYSIKKQFAGIFIGLMVGTMLLIWFINSTFLEEYYVQNREKALMNAYNQIVAAMDTGDISSDEFDVQLQRICSKYNIDLLIIDANSQTVKSSSAQVDILTRELLDNIFHGAESQDEILVETDAYTLQNTIDHMTETEYIEMWGTLDDSNYFLIRTAVESIRNSVQLSNTFLAYVGFITVILGAIVVYYVTKKVTEPIMKLTDISERMIHLDFDAKYEGKSKNELALLGENINKLSSNLEKTISELKTANNELMRDIEKKNEIDEMRKEFLSNVSHELKTPIALIQGYAEGLIDGISDDEESRNYYCEVIRDEADKMNVLVKKLLDLNQLEFGNDSTTFERFNITDLIHNTLQSVDILIKQKEITVICTQTEPIYVWADEFQTEEILRNYLSNAINHCDFEKIIEIKVIRNVDVVRISVFNTGIPIPEDSLACVWDKFYKVDKARTREYGGSGVGLSIVKAIMNKIGQNYGVLNYQNGVEFWFELSAQ